MTNREFEKFLQENVSPKINFRANLQNTDICGIYYDDIYTETAIPSGEIYPEKSPEYLDLFGYQHRGSNEAEARIRLFVDKFENDKEWRDDFLAIE